MTADAGPRAVERRRNQKLRLAIAVEVTAGHRRAEVVLAIDAVDRQQPGGGWNLIDRKKVAGPGRSENRPIPLKLSDFLPHGGLSG